MGLFKKKSDPISERARDLNAKIAALQAEIKRVSQQPSPAKAPPPAQAVPEPVSPPAPASPAPAPAPVSKPTPGSPQPRLRSTAVPHGPTINVSPSDKRAPKEASAPGEPIFEKLEQQALTTEAEKSPAPPDLSQRLGMRKNGFIAFYERLMTHFRGPATSNPKLVNYLAAGSIQGLRPLRYEKRIARNRFLVLAGALILLLWGIVAILLKHR